MDFGFVGQAYAAPDPRQDIQICVNWYPEISQDINQKSKTVKALLGCPGLTLLPGLPNGVGTGPVRGGLTLPGGAQALVASGNTIYLLSVATPPSATAKAILTQTTIGTIGSNATPVFMKSNGVGGFVWIVDGSESGYLYEVATQVLTPIADAGFYGASRIAFVDGWNIFNKIGTPIFYTSPPPEYSTLPFNATYFDLNDGTDDQLITLIEQNRLLLLCNENNSHWWYDAGGQFFPFQRLDGATIQVGCAAPQTIALFEDGIIWLGKNARGQNTVVQTKGFTYGDVSTIAINNQIQGYNVISDAFGYTYQENDHEFYMLTFPTADATWCYDGTTKMWHQRASFDSARGTFHRHRSNCYFEFQNYRIVGDYQNGNLYYFDRTNYTDNGAPLVAWRRCPHVWDEDNYERVNQYTLQIDFIPGLGTATGQGQNPVCMVAYSNDGGQTFGGAKNIPMGPIGKTKTRSIVYKLNTSRDRVYDVRVSDPVNRDVTSASLIADVP